MADAAKLVEYQWVQDLACTTSDRRGRVDVVTDQWVSVAWHDPRRKTYEAMIAVEHIPTRLRPVRGPVGELEGLEFAPPLCPFDDSSLEFDERWFCRTCKSRWDENGAFRARGCAAPGCYDDAVLIDIDGRPLCTRCGDHAELERTHDQAVNHG